MRTKNSCTD